RADALVPILGEFARAAVRHARQESAERERRCLPYPCCLRLVECPYPAHDAAFDRLRAALERTPTTRAPQRELSPATNVTRVWRAIIIALFGSVPVAGLGPADDAIDETVHLLRDSLSGESHRR